jgi:membrane protease YdiL (CAAX protease family)
MAEYSVWLERVRPLGIYLIVLLGTAALGLALRAWPAAGRAGDVAFVVVSMVAPVAIALRGGTNARSVMLGTLTPLRAVLLGIAAGLAGAALAVALAVALHTAAVPWSPIRPPHPDARWIALALVLPNAAAAAVVFQGWLQTKLSVPFGVWGAAAATLAIFVIGDRSAIGVAYALAPVTLRATNGSLLACVCAYLTQGIVANL